MCDFPCNRSLRWFAGHMVYEYEYAGCVRRTHATTRRTRDHLNCFLWFVLRSRFFLTLNELEGARLFTQWLCAGCVAYTMASIGLDLHHWFVRIESFICRRRQKLIDRNHSNNPLLTAPAEVINHTKSFLGFEIATYSICHRSEQCRLRIGQCLLYPLSVDDRWIAHKKKTKWMRVEERFDCSIEKKKKKNLYSSQGPLLKSAYAQSCDRTSNGSICHCTIGSAPNDEIRFCQFQKQFSAVVTFDLAIPTTAYCSINAWNI